MKRVVLLLIVPFALLMGVQTSSAQQKTAAPSSAEMKASSQRPGTWAKANWNSFKPETLEGTVSMVEVGKKSVFVAGSGGVFYKFMVTPRTKIEINGTTSSFEELAEQSQKPITVTFVARPNGNFPQRISVNG